MNFNMNFAERLVQLRREKGWSQETLAEYLDVSRQAVGKWESGRALPDVPKLVQMADIFGVSLDTLLRDRLPDDIAEKAPVVTGPLVSLQSLRYEYKSKARLFGIPLVHVCLGHYGRVGVAKGIIAIGNVAMGVLALGGVALGGIAFGGVSLGLLLALGGLSVGGFALGGAAVGVYAFGGFAVGMCALGGCAVASQLACGGYAIAPVASGGAPSGELTFVVGDLPATFAQFSALVKEKAPLAAEWFVRLVYAMGRLV